MAVNITSIRATAHELSGQNLRGVERSLERRRIPPDSSTLNLMNPS
jgi:hypothetical protein